jgi:microcompartment protein CcmL/EutN
MAVGGKGIVVISGDIGSLEAAVKPAIEYCKEEGLLAGYAIIRNPHEDVLRELF